MLLHPALGKANYTRLGRDCQVCAPHKGYWPAWFDYSELNLNQYSFASPCRTICTICGSSPCPDLNLIHYNFVCVIWLFCPAGYLKAMSWRSQSDILTGQSWASAGANLIHSNSRPCAKISRTGAKLRRCSGRAPWHCKAARCSVVP